MKPQLQVSHEPKPIRGETSRPGSRSTFPVTDCHYLGTSAELRGRGAHLKMAASLPAPALHELSNEFIASEMKRDYLAEAAAFVVIVAVAAWPIVSMVRAISQVTR